MTILEVAKKEIGYIEEKGNKTKYGQWFGFNGVMWCGIFISWCYSKADKKLPKIGWLKGFASCQFLYEYAKKNKWIVSNPLAGDIVLFDWNADGRYDHCGIYESKISATKFKTIEGNTSLTNQSNGGEVMSRTRSIKNCVFVRPIIL